MYKKTKNKTKNIGHCSNACLRTLCIMVLLCVAYTSYAEVFVEVKPLVYERVGAESILQCLYNTNASKTSITTLKYEKKINSKDYSIIIEKDNFDVFTYGTGYNKEKIQFETKPPTTNPYPKTSATPPLVDGVYASTSLIMKNLLLSDTDTYKCLVIINDFGGGRDNGSPQLVVFPAKGSITLSGDGKTLVTTRSSKKESLEVFVQDASGKWGLQKTMTVESEIYGAGRDISMSLTKDGKLLAIGSPVRSATSTNRAGNAHVVLLNEVTELKEKKEAEK